MGTMWTASKREWSGAHRDRVFRETEFFFSFFNFPVPLNWFITLWMAPEIFVRVSILWLTGLLGSYDRVSVIKEGSSNSVARNDDDIVWKPLCPLNYNLL